MVPMTLRDRAWRWQWAVRVCGAALLVAMGWIHWYLYDLGFSTIPTIGPLFLLNAALGGLGALALLVTPSRWLPLVELAGALLLLGTLGALLLSLTVGLFGFKESWDAPLIGRTIVVEGGGFVFLLGAAVLHGLPPLPRRRSRRGAG